MNDQFIPLVPRNSSSEPAQTATVAQSFQALHATAAPAHSHPHRVASPQVTLKRDGDRVTHISILCSCGQVVELACLY
jgi:hypothetical protein